MNDNARYLRLVDADEIPAVRRDSIDQQTLADVDTIIAAVRERGDEALREYGERFGDIDADQPLVLGPDELQQALETLDDNKRGVLERTARRIEEFATAQRKSLRDLEFEIPGGVAGHRVLPVERAACYAPGGRFPLPSSVLMTAVTARAAGVDEVWVASPKPTAETMAAAAIAGADGLLRVGGAQAIAAFAFGTDEIPACDAIVGPGNRWVTAAKQRLAGLVRIDMLAGPSELVVLADDNAQPLTVARDLLAQAEHDVDALPILVTTSHKLADDVEVALREELADLSTTPTAEAALKNGYAVIVDDLDEAVALCNRIAPEHLEVLCVDARSIAEDLVHFGGLFIGSDAAEVLGDYGAGPNHTLPTGGTARRQGGLSVLNFLKVSTWMRIDDRTQAQQLVEDAVALAKMEGLQAHARSAALRRVDE